MPDGHDQQTYYRASSTPDRYPRLTDAIEHDVCIVGAGFAGLGTALSLVERGHRNIAVLEAGQVGHGASGRNGGFVFGGFSLDEQALHADAGHEARDLYGHTREAMALIRRRIDRYEIDCDVRDDGVILANWFRDARVLDARQRFLADHMDVHWQRLSRSDMAERLGTERYSGGLFEPGAFHFHPLKYVDGVARTLAAAGVALHEHSAALRIVPAGELWHIDTAQGSVTAREVVVCCGGYLDKSFHPRLRAAILPIATYVMVTEPLGERLPAAIRTRAAVYDTRFAFDYYRALPDTRLLWGGRISALRRTPGQVARLLRRDMLRLYPQLGDVKVEHAWSGLMSYARHKMPQVGRLPDGVWYGMGFGGHGVAPTTLAGEVLARALCGDPDHLHRYRRWGLPWAGGKAGLAVAQMVYWAHGARDWLRS